MLSRRPFNPPGTIVCRPEDAQAREAKPMVHEAYRTAGIFRK